MSEEDEAALLDELRGGKQRAFDALMRLHGRAVYRYAWALADDPQHADDLVQETFLLFWKRRRQIRITGSSALPWLLTTCRYTAFNANRKTRRTSETTLDEAAHVTLADTSTHDELRWIREEIRQLSEADQRLIRACIVDGFSYREAAAHLGLTEPTARKRMQRVRHRLTLAQARREL